MLTILSSVVINELQVRTRGTNSSIAFAYCSYAERKTQTLDQLLGSIAQQLLQKLRRIPPDVLGVYENYNSSDPNFSTKAAAFRRIITLAVVCLDQVYIVVDALDECENKIRRGLVALLRNLGRNVHLLYTSRFMRGDEVEQELLDAARIKIRGTDEDVRTYLRERIQSQNNLVHLCAQNQGLSEKIVTSIANKTDGM